LATTDVLFVDGSPAASANPVGDVIVSECIPLATLVKLYWPDAAVVAVASLPSATCAPATPAEPAATVPLMVPVVTTGPGPVGGPPPPFIPPLPPLSLSDMQAVNTQANAM
jgi:hypothetical protein